MTTFNSIDRDLLKAILKGGKIVYALSRSNNATGVSAHVVIVEMPKDIIIEDFSFEEKNKYWHYLEFRNTPDISGWWHASSNNLSKRENKKKIWEEWSELKYIIKDY